ncbi:ATP-binding protein [Pseudonocardia humida]|uniref:histidine kinase n=1 Tax=Pseudonocardia humida TaxID=2800819 RepID=A0ABT0ZVL4_9PSEU|nr:ATP-binding protein [Pseudonocardia humida]MCO1654781.1 hypothetical protein [Pseudonocardia humida]
MRRPMWKALRDRRPSGHVLDTADWRPVHRLLLWVLAAHVAGLAGLGIGLGHPPTAVLLAVVAPAVCLGAGVLAPERSAVAAVAVAVGLVCSSAALIGLTGLGAARFHVFVVIGLVALYQSWAPLLSAAVLAVAGQVLAPRPGLPTTADPQDPGAWLPAVLFGGCVLGLALVSALLWGIAERYRCERDEVGAELTEAELGKRRFVSELLVNLARRSQGMVYRQLEILGRLREAERDPDLLAELLRLDHLAVRVRRNAGNLLVLAGEQAPRTGAGPTSLREVVRAAIAETEDLDRVLFVVDEQRTVAGRTVADLTHLLAEVIENAVRFSPPDSVVTVRSRPDHGGLGRVVTVEDWGVGMPEEALAEANELLTAPPELDLSVSQRLGLHVVARLAARHRIEVRLSAGAESGTVCSIVLPDGLFEAGATPAADEPPPADTADGAGTTRLPVTAAAAAPDAVRGTAPAPPATAPTQVSEAPVTARAASAQAGGPAEALTARVALPVVHSAAAVRPTDPRIPMSASDPRLPAVGRPTSPEGEGPSTSPRERGDASDPRLPATGATARVPAARPPATPATGVPSAAQARVADAAPQSPPTTRIPTTDPSTARPAAAETATARIPTTRPSAAAAPPHPSPAETSSRGAPASDRTGEVPAVEPPSEVPATRRPAETSTPAHGTPPATGRTEPQRPRTSPDPEQPGPSADRVGEAGQPTHPRPAGAPAGRAPVAAGSRRSSDRRTPESEPLPAPFGSTGSWEGWWESRGDTASRGDSPSPVAATAPATTGPWPVVGRDTGRGPSPRPRPPVAAPPGPARPTPSTGPITWVDPPDSARDRAHRADPPSGPALFDPGAELRRRVPQTNLVPELRAAPQAPDPITPAPHGHTRAAASALSRYQASREAARTAVHDHHGPATDDRSALPYRPIATNPAAERYAPARSGETVPEPGTDRPQPTHRFDDVPLDAAGDDPSTAPEHASRPGPTADAPARPAAGTAAAPVGAVSDGTATGENRAMDRDDPDPARDDAAPSGDAPADDATGGER